MSEAANIWCDLEVRSDQGSPWEKKGTFSTFECAKAAFGASRFKRVGFEARVLSCSRDTLDHGNVLAVEIRL